MRGLIDVDDDLGLLALSGVLSRAAAAGVLASLCPRRRVRSLVGDRLRRVRPLLSLLSAPLLLDLDLVLLLSSLSAAALLPLLLPSPTPSTSTLVAAGDRLYCSLRILNRDTV